MTSLGVALVTGAGRGIGRAIALRLAKDGFDVALNDLPAGVRDIEAVRDEILQSGRKATVVPADVSVESEVKSLVNEVVGGLGSLDVMVANAGICKPRALVDISSDEWDKIFSTNARGVFLSYKYAALQMIAQGKGGRIIGASSVAGKQGWPMLAAYSSTKFAVRGLTQSAATELGQYGVTVNAYSPGVIDTDMLRNLGDDLGNRGGLYDHEASMTALKRVGSPEEIANIVSFLASKESSYITGQSVSSNPILNKLCLC
ncbi:hypothetical protein HGRIS_000614 [Hohenbuehelia grisea]|uniref:Diacetyl reductase [(S)-acetoin forming] n=1 Tax=Hohenbuehelia grisea TaxID=104357 RepID=A0ABR3JRI6_9AGAR